ncbi:MAG: signal peptidase II, partial [Myxococcota bacterium]
LFHALSLIVGGALGNFVDRFRINHVIDFIDVVYWVSASGAKHWPTFNIADIAITVGVGLLLLHSFRQGREEHLQRPASQENLDSQVLGES